MMRLEIAKRLVLSMTVPIDQFLMEFRLFYHGFEQ